MESVAFVYNCIQKCCFHSSKLNNVDGVFDLDSVQCFLTEPLLTKIKDLLCDFKQDGGLLGVNLSKARLNAFSDEQDLC